MIYAFLVILFSCGQTKIVKDNDKERLDLVCDKFMQAFRAGNIPEPMQLLKKNSVIDDSTECDTLQVKIDDQMTKLIPAYGNIRSYEFVSEHKIKNIIAKRFYILKFDKYYLKFDFTLYNKGEGWTITNFKFDDDILELL